MSLTYCFSPLLLIRVSHGFLLFFKKYGIPHRLDVGFPPSFSPIKRGSLSSPIHTSSLHLRLFVVLPNCFGYLLFASIS